MGTLSGEATLLVSLLPHINWGHLVMERICSHWSKFFPLREDPILGRLCPLDKQTESHDNCLPLKTWLEKDRGVPIYSCTLNLLHFQDNYSIGIGQQSITDKYLKLVLGQFPYFSIKI